MCACVFSAVAAILLTGCGFQSASGCAAGPLLSFQSGSPNFTISADPFTIYPGQTKQITVAIKPIGNATGTVKLSGNYTGLTVSSATVAIGSTATLTVTAANNIASQCFVGARDVFDAGQSLTLTASVSSNTAVSQEVGMDVVLENPSFVPTTVDLPVMSINTTNSVPITSEDDYVDATVTIKDAAKSSYNYTGTTQIKGHGNSTWEMPKKPYRLKLDSKASLLGMTSAANWIMLADYDDKTLLRNDVAAKMSNMFGLFWTPNTAFVETYLNGAYQGVYQLSEKVEVNKARLNIGSIDDTDNSGTNLTGGYLGEIDHYGGQTLYFTSLVGLPIGLDDPDPPTSTQAAYFTNAFSTAETSMYKPTFTDVSAGWQAYWDKSSLVNYFLVEELAGNEDADDFSSDYFYKPRGDDKFYRGPVWDMDVTFGNVNYSPITDPGVPWVSTQSAWYSQLFKDPAFLQAVKTQWTAMHSQVLTLPDYIDSRAAALNQGQQNNFARWPILGEEVWPNSEAAGSYAGEVTFLKSWMTRRIAYMDSQYLIK